MTSWKLSIQSHYVNTAIHWEIIRLTPSLRVIVMTTTCHLLVINISIKKKDFFEIFLKNIKYWLEEMFPNTTCMDMYVTDSILRLCHIVLSAVNCLTLWRLMVVDVSIYRYVYTWSTNKDTFTWNFLETWKSNFKLELAHYWK